MSSSDKLCAETVWQVLQLSDALDLELATALAEWGPVVLWKPVRRLSIYDTSFRESEHVVPGSQVRIHTFPLVRGFARFPVLLVARTGVKLAARLGRQSDNPKSSVLVCTTPFFAPVAERWPGPVVYWLSDLIARYEGMGYSGVRRLDRRMCGAATLVCPNSERIAEYLQTEANCPGERCVVIPNATGARSLLPAPLEQAASLPESFSYLRRPIAGVIGNLAENTDWVFLEELLGLTPWLSWLFVGPTHMPIRKRKQRLARQRVMRHERACFTGSQPYTELFRFARAIDVAVLPYRHREPTFSGSSTRLYDHLAACHPILATPAVAELQGKEPLVRLVSSPEHAAAKLEALRASGFQDGQRPARWQASQQNTWRNRAALMRAALQERLRPA